ncbi:MAG: TIGR02270 family protein [Polyangiaceae bacterium]|nr:TIGR02270 family protein [Polyangiaceae bacterium]
MMQRGFLGQTTPPSMVLRDIVERHAQHAAFLWTMRDAAVRSPNYDLEALNRVDERLDANLDGLRVAGDVGWEIAKDALGNDNGGELFVVTVLALEREDVKALAQLLSRGFNAAKLAREIVSALGWLPFGKAKRYLDELLSADAPPELNYFGIAGAAVHRYDPGDVLESAAYAQCLRVRARALRAIGELGRVSLLSAVRGSYLPEDDDCRFWAAWSGVLFGETAALDVLWKFVLGGGARASCACKMVVRRMDLGTAAMRLRELGASSGDKRTAMAGAAALGDMALVPWLIGCMSEPRDARLAGWAFMMLTGIDLHAQQLSRKAPVGFRSGPSDDPNDANIARDPDTGLPWPNVDAIRAWWLRYEATWAKGQRYLMGKPIEETWLIEVLRKGKQPARIAAAIELAMMARGTSIAQVCASGYVQTSTFLPQRK